MRQFVVTLLPLWGTAIELPRDNSSQSNVPAKATSLSTGFPSTGSIPGPVREAGLSTARWLACVVSPGEVKLASCNQHARADAGGIGSRL